MTTTQAAGGKSILARVMRYPPALVALVVWSTGLSPAQTARGIEWSACLRQPQKWYSTREAVRIAENVLLYQYPSGGWPKNIDMAAHLSAAQKAQLGAENHLDSSTIDNRATYTQLRYLAKVHQATGVKRLAKSFIRGLDYLLEAQYPNGGWPQFYPLREGYYSHITFNDDAMIGVMSLLRDISSGHPDFTFVQDDQRQRARRAIKNGIDCILKCQIRVDGKLTAWCAQHDERNFGPAKARSYELPSLSGEESVGITEFLMSIENPSDRIKESIQSAISWFNIVRISGIRVREMTDNHGPEGRDRVVIKDESAPSMWARFYEIGTNRPFYCSRDGIKRFDLSEISHERRNNYSWLGYWPQQLLDKKYPRWAKKNSVKNVLK